jgi:hypothetical protein
MLYNLEDQVSEEIVRESMRWAVARMGWKVGDLIGFSTHDDGSIASTWEAEDADEMTYRVSEEDV